MVDLEAVGEVAHAGPAFVGVGDDDDLVSAVYKLLLNVSSCIYPQWSNIPLTVESW
jgi:hypothetical protein